MKKATTTLLLICVAVFAQQKGTFTDPRDKKTYKTVKIGEQVWMAENLNYNAKGSKCYDNKPANCEKYGRLYNWETAMKACPSGWHLPTWDEWGVLNNTVGRAAGKKLKAKNGWNNDYQGKSGNGVDEYGFSALPGGGYYGYGDSDGYFRDAGDDGNWWSGTDKYSLSTYEVDDDYVCESACDVEGDQIDMENSLFSVRCAQNDAEIARKKKEVARVAALQSSFTDSRDGKTYKTVKIGSQNWMAENLNYDVKGSKCYDDKPANCKKYGRLYNWATAMKIDAKFNEEELGGSDVKYRGVCPSGWHIPDDDEWETLVNLAGGEKVAGTKLKATENGTDYYGFSALPGGSGNSGGSFNGAGSYGGWWSAGEYTSDDAHVWYMYIDVERVRGYYSGKSDLLSVRCVQD